MTHYLPVISARRVPAAHWRSFRSRSRLCSSNTCAATSPALLCNAYLTCEDVVNMLTAGIAATSPIASPAALPQYAGNHREVGGLRLRNTDEAIRNAPYGVTTRRRGNGADRRGNNRCLSPMLGGQLRDAFRRKPVRSLIPSLSSLPEGEFQFILRFIDDMR